MAPGRQSRSAGGRCRARGCARAVLALAATLALLSLRQGPGFLPGAPLRSRRAAQEAQGQRRGLLLGGLIGMGLGAELLNPAPTNAGQTQPVTPGDLKKIRAGYDDLLYLMDNWNKATRSCTGIGSNVQQALAAGVQSPDNCKATPDEVRKYFGMRSMSANLYNTQQLWINLEASDLVPSKEEDRYQEAVEDFEKHKRQASEWAYTSSWGENNPGGGRDKVEDYLLRSKAEAALAVQALAVIVDVLKV